MKTFNVYWKNWLNYVSVMFRFPIYGRYKMRKVSRVFFSTVLFITSVIIIISCAPNRPAIFDNFFNVQAIDPLEGDPGRFLDEDSRHLAQKANEYYQKEDYENAARYYLAYLRQDGKDAVAIYNLACCYGLMDEAELAAKFLKRSARAGYEDVEHMKNDPDFNSVKEDAYFAAVLDTLDEKIGKRNELKGKQVWIQGNSYKKCRLHFPEDYDSTRAYPLLIGMHGWGDTPDNFIFIWNRFENPQFIYAALQAPYPFYSGGKDLGYSWFIWDNDESFTKHTVEMTTDYVESTIKRLMNDYPTSDVYLMGFSQGAYMSLSTGILNSDKVKGAIVFGGWLEEKFDDNTLAAGKQLRVFMGHGKEDRVVKFADAEKAVTRLNEHGYDVTFDQYDDLGHQIPKEAWQTVQTWMNE